MVGTGRILFSICLAGYVVAATGSGLDRISRRSPAIEAAVLSPFRAQADRSAASSALLRRDTGASIAHARASVARDPVDIDSAALLGSALLAAGQSEPAENAFRVAARFGWRNVATQSYWYEAALQVGDLSVAADRADAILRTHPLLVDERKLLEPFESQSAGQAILAEHLKQRPLWMKGYLTLPPNSSIGLIENRLSVVSLLRASNVSVGCEAAAGLAKSLIEADRWEEARTFWNANCRESQVSGIIGDATFTSADAERGAEPPFSWHVQPSGDILMQRGGRAPGSLQVTNSASTTRVILYQPVAFRPGVYQLRILLTGGRSEPGTLLASLGCDGTMPYPDKPEGDLTAGGQTFRVGQCSHQVLALWLRGNGATVSIQSLEAKKVL